MNHDFLLSVALPITLFLIMFSMGTGLLVADFKRVSEQPLAVLVGVISQMLLLPVLTLCVLWPFQLPPEIVVGFMILAFSPGGTTSNMFSYFARGNLALSITLTAIISVVTPITIPILAGLVITWQMGAGSEINLPFLSTFLKLLLVTLLPVSLGMILRHYKSAFCSNNGSWIKGIPPLMLLAVIIGVVYLNWAKMPTLFNMVGIPSLILASLALLVGYLFARMLKLTKKNARTIAIETGIQNGGTAILITGTILKNPMMTIAPVMYGILMMLPTIAYVLVINRNRDSSKQESFISQ